MMTNANETAQIQKILTRNGVRPRQQMTVIAGILELEYVSIQQKFSGKRSWTPEQLKLIAAHFNEPLSVFITNEPANAWNAILKISDVPQRCLIQHSNALETPKFENLVAVREADGWLVIPGTKVEEGQVCYKILKIDVLPNPRVAALDDNPDITDTIATMFAWQGVDVAQFQSIQSMLEAAKSQPFEGYVLDWMLSRLETAESAIVYIREKLQSNAPITILTGELRTTEVNQSEIAKMVERFDVTVLEKPAVLELLAKSFHKQLFRFPSSAS
ncbi:helix-turn-helix domain-containing protein [Glaciimonas immobilis]|uniref:CheY-like chemotaxis protein n=1 Tax=Glaciimonas immobilis TaxID=728004 RepID=A0A840RU60_9BURK|nr:helix-turn-helix domain-containing protein [Glaciimonas immobilis]KAF3998408.1 hypothetical protein HAV38_08120 [Glaciimonas immobilis]MBB5202107.1 CheY-like chemotaxis protein [Glaciimonas immobilis]